MFSKVLIANRGEIACRIIRTCRRMGIRTVAVYSEADKEALHVRQADEAFLIGPAPPSESYLNVSSILEAAKRAGVQALHPGYGFLSQNPAFARACHDAGIVFIGPSPESMERMGDKLLARQAAREAGLPLISGTVEAVDEANCLEQANRLGYPVMVKAAAGGGGIGIHVVNSAEEMQRVLAATRRLAQSAFGSPKLYMETYVGSASHIEVQVLGDRYGNFVHLYERDCSAQRRNQKVVEESPSTKLSHDQREKLTRYALALSKHIGYANAGTVEFLVSRMGRIYFLEMNTRLQVEHGVTELVTGLDLVELQIRVAAGEPLPVMQGDVRLRGHAIEVRVYPEDPETFMPSVGTITELEQPVVDNLRVDSALFVGYEVTPYYEPLLAKAMAWGEDRDEALERLYNWLRRYRIAGVTTNIPLLRNILTHPDFMSGDYDTGLLARLTSAAAQRSKPEPTAPVQEGAAPANGGHDDRELAAILGAAIALGVTPTGAATPVVGSPWKHHGLREQMRSHRMGGRSWR